MRAAFDEARAARGADGAHQAERRFLETLVRVHRRGEGAGFDGIKPTGTELAPEVVAADAVSRLVDQLGERDLARRSPNPADRRRVLVDLTDNGTLRAQRLAEARRALFAGIIDRLEVNDRRTVIDGLTQLEEAARARY